MIERLAEFFFHQQYGIQKTNFADVRILYKVYSSDVNVIVLFDLDGDTKVTVEQCNHILEQVEQAYYQKGYKGVAILSLLCTRNVELAKPYCQYSRYPQWVVDVHNNRLIVFENQPQSFSDVRALLDSILIGQYYRANPEFTEPVRMKRNSYFRGSGDVSYGALRSRLAGKPVFTIVLIAINVIIYLLMKITEGDIAIATPFGNIVDTQAQLQNYLNWGATSYTDIVDYHEYYRLFTAMFLHGGFEHLAGNMTALAVVGYLLETNFGSVRFLIIYLISGVFASIGSVFYFHAMGELVVGLGASGAIFGIVGAFAYLVIRYRGRGFDISASRFLLFALVTVYNGFRPQEEVDNIAHIVGFFIGIVTCIVLDTIRRNQRTR